MKIVRILGAAFLYFCVASFIAQTVGAGMLFSKGLLTQQRMVDVLAALYGLDLSEMRARIEDANKDDSEIQIAYDRVLRNRVLASLDIDLRESAIERSMGELRNLQNDVVVQRQRHEQVRQTFESRLEKIEVNSANRATQNLKQAVEQMSPKLAKDQLLRMVAEGDGPRAIAIMNAIKPDKLKKIIQEFKTDEDRTKLAQILKQIAQGRDQVDLLESTRSQLNQPNNGRQP